MRSALSLRPPALAAALAFLVAAASSLPAQDGLKDELRKIVGEGKKGLADEVTKAVEARQEKILDAILKAVDARLGERVSKLEADLKARDTKIAELEARLKDIAPKAAPAVVPFIGVGSTDVPADVKGKLKIEGGALVTQVVAGSPAAQAGIKAEDVIVDVNGTAVTSATLASTVAGFKPDQEINVTYFQGGQKTTKSVKLVDREKFFADLKAKEGAAEPKKREPVVLGVTLQEQESGVVVDGVEEGFTGHAAGLKVGDKVTHLNGKELKTIDDVVAELKKSLEGDSLVLVWKRGEETVTAKVVGSHGKEGAKLVSSESQKPKPKEEVKPKEEPKPAQPPKPGILGVAVVPDAAGVVVESVIPETAAAAAGLKKGDVIRKAAGHDINDVDGLKGVLSKANAGDRVSLVVSRDGKDVEVKDIVLKAEGEKVATKPAEQPKPGEPQKPKEEPKPAVKKRGSLGITASQTSLGITVKIVNPGGAAEKAELKVGDIILKANDKAIASFDDLEGILKPLFAGDEIRLHVKRGNEEKDVKVSLGETQG